ncbi:MAG TPA: hypothetical protein VNZ49_11285 [Bacteroidia bacterium]|jgi:hypothetical protein|nr:hypothetical protein [Bacteroidia bacterium]
MKRLRIFTLCSALFAAGIFFFKKRNPTTLAAGEGLVLKKEWLTINKKPATPSKDTRLADQTFLTFPEWYLVFSPEEQANYFKTNTASTFPYMSHTAQIWQSYKIVNDQIKDNFPPNKGYHFMIWVIGTSASAEYSIKAWYETIIGRITDTHEVLTDEDKFNTKYTRDYVDFIKNKPWYEFDFKSRFGSLWSTSFFGSNFLRKLERKYILTSELIVKTVYGKLIKMGTQTVYEEALPTTAVLIEKDSAEELVNLPRYDKFNAAASEMASKGYRFKEIAGNTSAILLTILVDANNCRCYENSQQLFTQPLSSDPGTKRVALAVRVKDLHKLLLKLNSDKVKIEHVFDY